MFEDRLLRISDTQISDTQEALTQLGELLLATNHVKQSFIEAIINREEEFPTGLIVDNIGVAIPHADVEHVKSNQLAIMTLEEPVMFKSMEDSTVEVPVRAIFMLALNEPHGHLEMLQKIMQFIQNKEDLETFIQLSSDQQTVALDLLQHYQII